MSLGNCPAAGTAQGASAFTIGIYQNSFGFINYHSGAMKSVHLFEKALSLPQMGLLYGQLSGNLRNSTIRVNEYWVQGKNDRKNVSTPNKDFMHATSPIELTIRGRFVKNSSPQGVRYKCLFASVDSAQESAIANIMDLENVPFARIGV
jgi:hypothetical protein